MSGFSRTTVVLSGLSRTPNTRGAGGILPDAMRIAALFDIHANLPALDAVLDEVRHADVDRIVLGGDVLPGPMAMASSRCSPNWPPRTRAR